MHPPRPKLLLLRGCGAPCFRRGGAACAKHRAPGVSRARLDTRAVYAGTTSSAASTITTPVSIGAAVSAWCRWTLAVAQLLIRRRRPSSWDRPPRALLTHSLSLALSLSPVGGVLSISFSLPFTLSHSLSLSFSFSHPLSLSPSLLCTPSATAAAAVHPPSLPHRSRCRSRRHRRCGTALRPAAALLHRLCHRYTQPCP